MRGKLRFAFRACKSGRNIPAYAGKTRRPCCCQRHGTEHPRARGENAASPPLGVSSLGTSPRTRGKPCSSSSFQPDTRNIPAHAGKTGPELWPLQPLTEHPRARGENCSTPRDRRSIRGTSPRTRGKRGLALTGAAAARNIPAHAGKTPKPRTAPRQYEEHPRARGENLHRVG